DRWGPRPDADDLAYHHHRDPLLAAGRSALPAAGGVGAGGLAHPDGLSPRPADHAARDPDRNDHRRRPGPGRDRAAAAHRHECLRCGDPGDTLRSVQRAALADLPLAGQREPQLLRGAHLGRDHGSAGTDDHHECHRRPSATETGASLMISFFRTAFPAAAEPVTAPLKMASYETVRTLDPKARPARLSARNVSVFYGDKLAIDSISIDIPERSVSALIGPSGCGKSTFLRCLNRMNDTIEGARVIGEITLDGENLYHPGLDVVELRARIGMVFQKPNPFPKSIFENVAYGP